MNGSVTSQGEIDLASFQEYLNVPIDLIEVTRPCAGVSPQILGALCSNPGLYSSFFNLKLLNDVDLGRLETACKQVSNVNPLLRTHLVSPGRQSAQLALLREAPYNGAQSEPDSAEGITDHATALSKWQVFASKHGQAKALVWSVHGLLAQREFILDILRQLEAAYREPSEDEGQSADSCVCHETGAAEYLKEDTASLAPPEAFRSHESNPPQVSKAVCCELKDFVSPFGTACPSATLVAAWSMLTSLLTNSKVVQIQTIKTRTQRCRSPQCRSLNLPFTNGHAEIAIDWSSPISGFLDEVEQNHVEITCFSHSLEGLLCLLDFNDDRRETFEFMGIEQNILDQQLYAAMPYDLIISTDRNAQQRNPSLNAYFDERSIPTERVTQLLQQLSHLFHTLKSGQTEQPLASLDLPCCSDLQKQAEWNSSYPSSIDECVHYLIDRRCYAQPAAPAVCGWDVSFTYHELAYSANQLASYLVSHGVGSDSVVLLCFEKSGWAAVAMLAILEAGAAIVAVDPADSLERTETIIRTSGARVALTSSEQISARLRGLLEHAINARDENLYTASRAKRQKFPNVSSTAVAWIIFTSGSTGKPKGVVLEHAAICTSASASSKAKHIDSHSRVFAFSNYIFDGAIQDYLFTLIQGGCICVPSEKDSTDNLAKCMNGLGVNWTFLTPSVVSLLAPSDVPALKVLTLGGEALTTDNINTWANAVTLQNTYGPAECTVGCSVRQYNDANGDPRNIGFPIGSVAWVANPENHDQLLPHDCIGELLLEGPMLARGYLGDDSVTKRSFIDDPPWLPTRPTHARRRVYKTGDLVKRIDDGSLVFFGRKDDQIKLRGQRIDIAGLNDFFASHRLVKHAYVALPISGYLVETLTVVLSLPDRVRNGQIPQPLRLVERKADSPLEEQIRFVRSEMERTFARYMVPTTWLLVEDLPLTPSGKIDAVKIKKWLQHLEIPSQGSTVDSPIKSRPQSSTSPLEMTIRRGWNDILGIPSSTSIRKDAAFFELGGNSLRAMALSARLSRQGISLAVADILRHPTLGEMAELAATKAESPPRSIGLFVPGLSVEDIARQCSVDADNIDDIYPAVPFQEALLTLTSRDPGAYVVHRNFHLPTNVDVIRLREAWHAVCRANSILRTRFVHDIEHGTLSVVLKNDLCWIDSNTARNEAESTIDQDFTFGRSLLRLFLFGRTLRLSIHHAIYDGWSIPLILQDVASVFNSNITTQRPSFKSFVAYASNVDEVRSEEFWKSRLSEVSATPFPSLADPAYQPSCTGSLSMSIELERDPHSSTTTASLATAAWALVLSRYTGEPEVCFGLITSGRLVPLDGAADIIGALVTTVPMRVSIDGNARITDLLETVQEDTIAMVPYAHYGLQKIQNLSPQLRSATLFHNTFIVHPQIENSQPSSVLIPEDVEEVNPADYRTYPLHVSCTLSKNGLDMKMRFDPAIVCKTEIQYLSAYLKHVLQIMATNELQATVREVFRPSPPMTESLALAAVEEPVTVDELVHDLVSVQVSERPQAQAICSWDVSLSYADLQALSDRLACRLRLYGVQPEVHVCFSFQKSAIPVIAILAIMKAGGVCVPLEVNYPAERVRLIVETCRSPVILCSKEQCSSLQDISTARLIIVDLEMLARLPFREESSNFRITPRHSCYCIFTSGSTGNPKGCVWEHRTLASSSIAHGKAMFLGPSSRVLAFASFIWDISVCEIITTLIHGGCICMPSEESRLSDTVHAMNSMEVTWAWLTPTFARTIDLRDAAHLQTLVLGGELIGQDMVDQYRSRFRLLTGYGPAETCIVSSVADFSANPEINSGNIGPGVGSRLWIVDQEDPNILLPTGALGEILIGGPTVCRGYINDSERTKISFHQDLTWITPHMRQQNCQFYRSGDLGKANADGSVTFVGRGDDQVKVRGQRLETGEVEHHLHQNGVRHAMVFLPTSSYYKGQLTAVVALDNTEDRTSPANPRSLQSMQPTNRDATKQLRDIARFLSSRLPPHGVPTVWLTIPRMPLMPSGKLDRLAVRKWALHALETKDSRLYSSIGDVDRGVLMPSTPRERALQASWADVLKIPTSSIGMDDSFHRFPADSIHAIKLVSRLRSQGLSLTVQDVFKNPIIRDMALRISSLSSPPGNIAPFALLPTSLRKGKAVNEASRLCNVAIEQIQDTYPATPLQEAVFSSNLARPGAYFAQLVYRAPLNTNAHQLAAAWQEVGTSHAILRTRLVPIENAGTFQVVVNDELPFESVNDLSSFLKADARQVIDSGDPMARLTLAGDYVVLTIHHAAYDALSLPMIIEDFKIVLSGAPAPQRPPFRNFVQYLTQGDQSADERFWSSYLSEASQTSFPRSSTGSIKPNATASKRFKMIFEKPEHHGSTTANVVTAAWSLILSAYEDSRDVSFGTVLSGRDVPVQGIAEIAGPTLATVPVRHRIDHKSSAVHFLEQTSTLSLDIMQHQHLGLQRIMKLHDDASAACTFKTILVIYPAEDTQKGTWQLDTDKSTGDVNNFSMYPLTLLFRMTTEGAFMTFNYDSDFVSERQVDRIADLFQHVFLGLLSSTRETPLREIVDITPSDRAEIEGWNASMPLSDTRFIHSIISKRALQAPSNVAVQAWDGRLTTGELDALSNRLASKLRSLGARPGTFIAYCSVKSQWATVAMLAILKSGAAFVPFNPADAMERKRRLASKLRMSILLTSASVYEEHKDLVANVLSLTLSSLNKHIKQDESPPSHVTPDSPAYCIPTSGSTGEPKLPVISHSALTTSIMSLIEPLQIRQTTKGLQFASHVFDLSILEMLGPLAAGGCVCIPSDDDRLNDLASAAGKFQVDWVFLTPTFARSLKPQDFPTLKTVVLGGEKVPADLIQAWSPHVQLFGIWAPSETTIINTIVELREPDQSGELGRAVNCRCWIVQSDDPNQLAPVGALGELVVEGPVVGLGYHDDPDRTASVFIDGLEWSTSGSPCYRTGDIAQYDADGTLRFIGRRDDQTKIRGQRIELGEIEFFLCEGNEVQDAAAILPSSGPFASNLVAVFSLNGDHIGVDSESLSILQNDAGARSVRALQSNLAESLPGHAVPSVFIPVNKLPQTASGKLDRRRIERWLSELDHKLTTKLTGEAKRDRHELPESQNERLLQKIWVDVLNIESQNIGRNSSFFQLGGDSISAMQVVARCRATGLGLTVQTMMKSKTLARTAEHMVAKQQEITMSNEDDAYQVFRLSPIQKVFAMLGGLKYRLHQSFMLSLNGDTRLDELKRALAAMIEYHPMLRCRFAESHDGEVHQEILPFEMENVCAFEATTSSGTRGINSIIEQAQNCIDLTRALCIAAVIIKTAERRFVFLTAHHFSIDLVSWRVVIQDLEDLLRGKRLPKQTSVSFKKWTESKGSVVGRSHTNNDEIAARLVTNMAYWNMAERLNLTEDTTSTSFTLSKELTSTLFGPANKAFTTEPVDLLLAALWVSFAQIYPDRDVPSIFSEAHGRDAKGLELDVSRTVGWFTTLQPLILKLGNDWDNFKVIRQVKESRKKLTGEGSSAMDSIVSHSERRDPSRAESPAEIVFNFAGDFRQLERSATLFSMVPAGKFRHHDHGTHLRRLGLFDFELYVLEGQVHISLSYNRNIPHPGRIEAWLQTYAQTLETFATDLPQRSPEFTPSDYPLLQAEQADLDALIKEKLPDLGINDLVAVEDMYSCTSFIDLLLLEQLYFPKHNNIRWTIKLSPIAGQPKLRPDRLVAAWRKVVERQSMLRTLFVHLQIKKSFFQQIVVRHCEPQTFLLHAENDDEARAKVQEYPSLLQTKGKPAHSLGLCTVPTGEIYCRLEINHAIIDGTSFGYLWKELVAAYFDRLSTKPAPLYSDFIGYFQRQPLETNTAFWENHLSNVEPSILPLGPKPAEQPDAQLLTDVSSSISVAALHTFCHEHSVTPPAVIETAWALFVASYTGTRSAVFAYPNSGRDVDLPGIQEMWGPTLTFLVCRLAFARNETFAELVTRVQAENAERASHQQFNWMSAIGDASKIFNTSISIQARNELPGPEEVGVKLEHVLADDHAGSDIMLAASYSRNRVSVILKHHRARSTVEFAKGMGRRYAGIMNRILEGADEVYDEVDLAALEG